MRVQRRLWLIETWLVLGVSLGASAIWSALSLTRTWAEAWAQGKSLSEKNSHLNSSRSDLAWLDLTYQIVGIALALVPVALAIYLLVADRSGDSIRQNVRSVLSRMGIDTTRRAADVGWGALLAAGIGIPGLVLYVLAKTAGVNTTVAASGLGEHWWTVPVLVLSAAQNAVLEEVLMIGYLFARWYQVGWSTRRITVASALIRGAYHLYQGLGGFIGNAIMGVIFGYFYTRTRRVLPLVTAHTILDVVAFVGYALLRDRVGWL